MRSRPHQLLARRLTKSPVKPLVHDLFPEILEWFFSEEEADVLSRLPIMPVTAQEIAKSA